MGVATVPRNKITRAGITDSGSGGREIYVGWYRRFLVLFGALALAVIAGASFDSSLGTRQTLVVVGIVIALALWFWFYGQWHLVRSDAHAIAYLLGNVIGITVCIRLWEPSAMMLFAMYWLGFAYLYTRYAIVYAFILTVATQWAFGTVGSNLGFNLDTLVAVALLVLLLGWLLGLFVYSNTPKTYESAATIDIQRVKREAAEVDEEGRLTTSVTAEMLSTAERLKTPALYARIAGSESFAAHDDIVFKKLKLPWQEEAVASTADLGPERASGMMRDWVSVRWRRDTTLIDLSARHSDPELRQQAFRLILVNVHAVARSLLKGACE